MGLLKDLFGFLSGSENTYDDYANDLVLTTARELYQKNADRAEWFILSDGQGQLHLQTYSWDSGTLIRIPEKVFIKLREKVLALTTEDGYGDDFGSRIGYHQFVDKDNSVYDVVIKVKNDSIEYKKRF